MSNYFLITANVRMAGALGTFVPMTVEYKTESNLISHDEAIKFLGSDPLNFEVEHISEITYQAGPMVSPEEDAEIDEAIANFSEGFLTADFELQRP